jgi:hypothetical protein
LIQWRSANPTSYLWDTTGPVPTARLVLQAVEQTFMVAENDRRVQKKRTYYVFQVLDGATGGWVQRELIDGSKNQILDSKMRDLFAFVRGREVQTDLDFLKQTLPRKS